MEEPVCTDPMDEEKKAINAEIEAVEETLNQLKATDDQVPLSFHAKDNNVQAYAKVFKKRKTLELQPADVKVSGLSWSNDNVHLACTSQQSRIVVFDAMTQTKELLISPALPTWYMFCEFSPDSTLLAAGGLDNACTVFKLNGLADDPDMGANVKPHIVLEKHMGYMGDAKFFDDRHIMTCSGDRSMILWDITQTKKADIATFKDHKADVHSMAIIDDNVWVSCSADTTSKLWDKRIGGVSVVATFKGHEKEVHSIKAFPSKTAFGTASEDGTCRLFDIRCGRQMNIYADDENRNLGATSLAFNSTGSIIFAGHSDGSIVAWDVITGEFVDEMVAGHDTQVSRLVMSPDGKALASSSRSNTMYVWA